MLYYNICIQTASQDCLSVVCRSTATGAGVGDENAADPVEAVLPGREAEPTRAVHQGRRGERTSSLSSLIGVPYCRRMF